ncbi:MAG: hypothetical protein CMJ81_18410 [Planctomycetaceae bacterium]|jgi:acetyl esterase/lipase|nr:hypothetical protein [Planctomycetaceae bacterium]
MDEIQTNPAVGQAGVISVRVPPGSGPHPFLLGIHGGGWQNGDRKSYDWCWDRLETLRVALVLCTHRPASEARFPAAYDDLLHLLRWLYVHAADHRLDRARCGLFGCSSGGHLVSLLAVRATKEEQDIVTIRAAASYAGIMDLARWHGELANAAVLESFTGSTPAQDPVTYRAASPVHHLHDSVPPLRLVHDAQDEIVPVAQSQCMFDAMNDRGLHPVLELTHGLGHYRMNAVAPGEEQEFILESELFEFFRTHGLEGRPGN